MSERPQIMHGTAIALDGAGILLLGKSGSGKSDLALRLIDRGAALVGDDAVEIGAAEDQILLRAAPNIAGKIEMRGVGIVIRPFLETAPLRLVLLLDEEPERMPDAQWHRIGDVDVAALRLNAFEASAPLKVEEALKHAVDAGCSAVAGDGTKP